MAKCQNVLLLSIAVVATKQTSKNIEKSIQLNLFMLADHLCYQFCVRTTIAMATINKSIKAIIIAGAKNLL